MEVSSSSLINLSVGSLLGYPTLFVTHVLTLVTNIAVIFCYLHHTWAHLQCVEGLKSDHTPATVISVIKKKIGSEIFFLI